MNIERRLRILEKKLLENKEPNTELLDKYVDGTYKVNSDKSVDVTGNFKMIMTDTKSILDVAQFGKVSGYFDVRGNKLTSLEGSPSSTGGLFSCANNPITTLEHSPEKVGGNFDAQRCKLTSLKGLSKEIGGTLNVQKNPTVFKVKDILGMTKIDKNKVIVEEIEDYLDESNLDLILSL